MEKPAVPIYPMEKSAERISPVWINDIGFTVLIVSIAVLFGFLPIFGIIESIDYTWVKLIQLVSFFLLGILNAVFIEKYFFVDRGFRNKILYAGLLSILTFAALYAVYFFKSTGSPFLAGASASAFLLPFVIDQSWKSFYFVSPSGFSKPWYNTRVATREKVSVFLTGIPVQIVLPVKTVDRHKKAFNSLAPEEMKLGEFFDHFILLRNNNERQNIETTDPEEKPFGWAFYEAKMGGFKRRRLDPEVNLAENEIRRNATIIAERVVDEYERGSN